MFKVTIIDGATTIVKKFKQIGECAEFYAQSSFHHVQTHSIEREVVHALTTYGFHSKQLCDRMIYAQVI